jgi:hypothetical protein
MESLKKHIVDRMSSLKDAKRPLEPYWKKLSQMCSFAPELWEEDKNRRHKQQVFDNTARNSLTYFSASMKSIICPTTGRWHRLKSSRPELEENDDVQRYLQYVSDLLFKVRYQAGSMFPVEADLLFNQLGVYGTSVWYVGEDVGKKIVYKSIPFNEVYIDRNELGELETVYREYELTASRAYELYGNACSKEIKGCLEKEPNRKFKFIHAVELQKDRDLKAKDYRGMKYASYQYEVESQTVVKKSGYRTMPYSAPRFLGMEGLIYGDSPALQAFYDILTANEMGKTILRTGQLQANPPILASQGLIDSNKLGMAGAVVRGGLDSQGRPTALSMQYGNNLAVTLEMQREVRLAIEKAFLVPLFQALTQEKEMTATEVEKREVEKAMLLAPMCERIASEWLMPMIERELDVVSQYGLLDGVPDELMFDGSLGIEFESPFVHLQDSAKITGMYKWLEANMTMAQADPSVLDIVNLTEASRKIANYYDVDRVAIRSREEVDAMGEQRAQQQQAEQLLGASEVLTKSLKNVGYKGGKFGF